jgi:N6-adenosine-specific RNA methylase IME4
MSHRVLVADPPWLHRDQLPGPKRGARKHYDCLGIDGIKAFPIPPMLPDSWLFLWKVASMPQEALDVCKAWGFRPVSEIVWVKLTNDRSRVRIGMGSYVRCAHESCIVAVRGKAASTRISRAIPSVIQAPRHRHSEKPAEFYDLVESLVPGPYVELFARRHRPGWMCLGNELSAA